MFGFIIQSIALITILMNHELWVGVIPIVVSQFNAKRFAEIFFML